MHDAAAVPKLGALDTSAIPATQHAASENAVTSDTPLAPLTEASSELPALNATSAQDAFVKLVSANGDSAKMVTPAPVPSLSATAANSSVKFRSKTNDTETNASSAEAPAPHLSTKEVERFKGTSSPTNPEPASRYRLKVSFGMESIHPATLEKLRLRAAAGEDANGAEVCSFLSFSVDESRWTLC